MKLSFFLVLIAIIGFLMTAHVNCHQKRQESEESEDGPGPMSEYENSGVRPGAQVRK